MKTIIIYFSYTGKTKKFAEEKAALEDADILALELQMRRGNFLTYTAGSLAARGHKKAKLRPYKVNLSQYEKIIIGMPIWAGNPAPAMNNILQEIPKDKKVELIFTSGSGNSRKSGEYVKSVLSQRHVKVIRVTDVKASDIV